MTPLNGFLEVGMYGDSAGLRLRGRCGRRGACVRTGVCTVRRALESAYGNRKKCRKPRKTKEKARCLLFVNNGLVYFSGFNYTRAVPHSLFTRVNERHHHACMLKLRIIFQLCFCKYMRSVRKMQIFYELFSTPIYVRNFYRTLRKNLYFCMIIRKFKT